jgi:hypothetical protein
MSRHPLDHRHTPAGPMKPGAANAARESVGNTLSSTGSPLEATTRKFMEAGFGQDFSHVRVHTDGAAARSARALDAAAYTTGGHIAFGRGNYSPGTSEGRNLLAHELAHVVQQGGRASRVTHDFYSSAGSGAHESQADLAAEIVSRGGAAPALQSTSGSALQRRVEMRDVGRGEQSGFARLPELIVRLNEASGGLTFSMDGSNLIYETRDEAALTNFDRQMMGFIDQDPVIPLRLTNRNGLLGDRVNGFNFGVEADAWESGYVDIDDLLASSNLGLQFVLAHFIRERSETTNYARRIGSASMRGAAADREFDRAHRRGIDSEVEVLRGFFNDPTIRFVFEQGAAVFRVYRNARGDRFHARMTSRRGVDAVTVDVLTPDNVRHTPEDYLRLLREERIREQVRGERLRGADEHRAGGRGVPAP